REPLSPSDWQRLFREADSLGISFILLTGGEPMMNPEIIRTAAAEKNLIFPVFTNGTLLDVSMVELFDASRNLVPVFSLEGGRETTDERRGQGVFDAIMATACGLRKKGILFGMSITVSTGNIHEVTSPAFLKMLEDSGVAVVFLIEYTATAEHDRHLELTADERNLLADCLAEARKRYRSVWFLSFPGDEEYMGGCLAAGRGFFHINPYGDAEPCPFSPVSDCNLRTATLRDALQSPLFYRMNEAGFLSVSHDGGCALAGRQEEIEKLLK
ncbi:MAG TPA: radical SAM/SPASM domain-containing protein, partial [Methanocorpusculum sp.]|nr:radical SAM/SPASM domain-containing protein [Methanocorpusculum sp.]